MHILHEKRGGCVPEGVMDRFVQISDSGQITGCIQPLFFTKINFYSKPEGRFLYLLEQRLSLSIFLMHLEKKAHHGN